MLSPVELNVIPDALSTEPVPPALSLVDIAIATQLLAEVLFM